MEDAGFIIGSYVLTFASVGLLAWRYVRSGRKLAQRVPVDQPGSGHPRGAVACMPERTAGGPQPRAERRHALGGQGGPATYLLGNALHNGVVLGRRAPASLSFGAHS